MTDFLGKLKQFDAYPKTIEDFRIRTFSGAAVSIISGIFILFLFISEISYYLQVEVHPELFVDTSRGEKLRINMDITFPSLPCLYLSVDAMDISGEHQLDVDHNVLKKRLTKTGQPLAIEKEDIVGGERGDNEEKDGQVEKKECRTCYGAESKRFPCCNSCEDVQNAYKEKGWAFGNPDRIAQCKEEGFSDKIKNQSEEGCQVFGYILVNK